MGGGVKPSLHYLNGFIYAYKSDRRKEWVSKGKRKSSENVVACVY